MYTSMSWGHACVAIRLSGPWRSGAWELVKGNSEDSDASDVSGADLVVFHREFPGLCSNYGKILWKCRMEQKPVVYELDDLLSRIPQGHASFEFLSGIAPSIASAVSDADAVLVSTEKLKSELSVHNRNIFVVPNCLDDDLWTIRPPRHNPELVKIGYAATTTHRADAELIAPALADLADRWGSRINIEFVGVAPPAVLQRRANVVWHQMNDIDYADYVRVMNTKAFDIGIAPLIDNDFNRCKSYMKYLEYSAMGAVGVYSNLEPYLDVVEPGVNGFLAQSPEDWAKHLSRLVETPELRLAVANQAQHRLRENFLLSARRPEIWDVWRAAATVE